MNIKFDNYKYNGAWYGKEEVEFNGQQAVIDIQIDGYDDVVIPRKSQNALLNFLDTLNDKTYIIAEAVFKYYQERREELGYSDEMNIDYPEIREATSILDMLTLIGITIPDQDGYTEEAVSLVFNCTWDKENGVGICFVGQNIVEVGFQDIAL